MFFCCSAFNAEQQSGAEMQKIKYDKVRQLDKIVFLALGLILVALVIQMAILNWINNRNISKMSEVLLDRVVNVIEKNEQDEKDMIASLKEDYIVRAKAVAYIINANPEADKESGKIYGATDSSDIGKKLDDIGITKKGDEEGKIFTGINEIDSENYRCSFYITGDYAVGVACSNSSNAESNAIALLIVGIYLTLAAVGIIYMYVKVNKAKIDELTGCLNRRAYKDDLSGISLASEFVYAALDVNGLKGVNDTLGHNAGDELIHGAAECMKQCFGSYGKVYRIGGDEFVSIIFVDESELKKIREDFDEVISHWSGAMVNKISISCGYVYSREKNWESFEEIASEADIRMYEAKEKYYSVEGRDRRK